MLKILTGFGAIALLLFLLGCSQSANSSTADVATSPTTASPENSETATPIAQASDTLDCDNAMTQMEMNACAAEDAQAADAELNRVYQQLRGTITEDAQAERLIAAQQAWITFRDADCAYSQYRYDGGSIMPMIYANCIAERTTQRTQELEMYLDDRQMR